MPLFRAGALPPTPEAHSSTLFYDTPGGGPPYPGPPAPSLDPQKSGNRSPGAYGAYA